MTWTSRSTEDQLALKQLCHDFAAKEIAPHAAEWWDKEVFPSHVFKAMGELGLMGLLVPEQYGGTNAGAVAYVAAMEEIGAADQSVAAAWNAHTTIASLPLLAFGTEEQKQRWLRPLAEGRRVGCVRTHRARGRLRRRRHPHAGRAGRQRVGHQRHEDVHLERRHRDLPRRHDPRRHRGERRRLQAIRVDLHPRRHARLPQGRAPQEGRLAQPRHPRARVRRLSRTGRPPRRGGGPRPAPVPRRPRGRAGSPSPRCPCRWRRRR